MRYPVIQKLQKECQYYKNMELSPDSLHSIKYIYIQSKIFIFNEKYCYSKGPHTQKKFVKRQMFFRQMGHEIFTNFNIILELKD